MAIVTGARLRIRCEVAIMFYSAEMINKLGYDSIENFVYDYLRQHPNCCVRYKSNGVYLNYDLDSQLGIGWI